MIVSIRSALTIALSALLLTACAAPSPTPPAAAPTQAALAAAPTQAAAQASQQVTISLSFIATGSEQMAPLVNDFQKVNPNIKVNVQYLPQATLGQATVTALQAGNAPDVLYTNGGTGQLHSVFSLGKAGYLADLAQRAWAKDVPPAARDMFFDGNKLYGAPMGLSLVGVVYNTELFKQLGLQIPSTFAGSGGPVRQGESRGQDPDGARRSGAGALRPGARRQHRLRQQSELERGSRSRQSHLRRHARVAGRSAAIHGSQQRRVLSNPVHPPTRS